MNNQVPESPPEPQLVEYASDVTVERVLADLERLEREDPKAYQNHQRAQKALADGEISIFVAMDEEGLTYKQAKRVIAEQDRHRRRQRAHPGAYKFRCQLEELRKSIPKVQARFITLISSRRPCRFTASG